MKTMTDGACDGPIRVFLLVANRLLHQALTRLFRKCSDIAVLGEGWVVDAKVSDVLDSKCDVLVTAVSAGWLLPNLGLESLEDLDFKTVLIGMDADEEQFLAAVRFGVSGYLLKDASAAEVVATVRAVHRGAAVSPRELSSALFRLAAKASKEAAVACGLPKPRLTARQQQLVALMAKGLTNKEIALQLNLSSFTVRNHIHRILTLVDAHSRSEAVEMIRANGYAIPRRQDCD